jgi:hypothetical protein
LTAAVESPENQEERTNRLLVGAVYVLAGIVALVVLIVSSNYLHEYATGAGMADWLAWTLVVALDAGGAAGTLVWVVSDGPARAWGRGIAVANLGGSVLGNILGHLLEAKAINGGVFLQILTGVVYPAELWAMVHLALVFRRERTPTTPAEVVPTPHVPAEQAPAAVFTPEPHPVIAPPRAPLPIPPAARPAVVEVPTPVRQPPARKAKQAELTPELLAKVRAWRGKRMQAGLPVGRRPMAEDPELNISDGLARKVLHALAGEIHQLRATGTE